MLFSERYSDLIDVGHGEPVDNICNDIDDATKAELSGTMREFAEPQKIYPDRYSSYDVTTTALELAIDKFDKGCAIHQFEAQHIRWSNIRSFSSYIYPISFRCN